MSSSQRRAHFFMRFYGIYSLFFKSEVYNKTWLCGMVDTHSIFRSHRKTKGQGR